ncbi:hypothetical protein E4656_00050 [Natronospirillum operosum]|uniref:Protein kinase domain-containing protein n=1 Tax=Natronospirillum operosum TaxID=2759953 RepID=A0A4Z0WCW6_9GAMM|nr:hypothetical protein [Natronospirillum operosum]TGG94860.1 hypothetical protein E4656_00050 [Natronospirillum operosum]
MPSTSLTGETTECGWHITEKISQKSSTGGNFCTQYIVINEDGRKAFLKAMDLKSVMQKDLQDIQGLIGEYLFERNILYLCKEENMTKIVTPLSSGEITSKKYSPPLNRVFFIVFELADSDFRTRYIEREGTNWIDFFRSVKHVCIAAEQLHRAGIAHQDIKPSNVLNFYEDNTTKVADLGRVIDENGMSPFNNFEYAGDMTYAPIEIRHRHVVDEFSFRILSDMHSIGSLIYHKIMGVGISVATINESTYISPDVLSSDYTSSVEIHASGFAKLLRRFKMQSEECLGFDIAQELENIVSEMCHPDINLRCSNSRKFIPPKVLARRYAGKLNTVIRLCKVQGVS